MRNYKILLPLLLPCFVFAQNAKIVVVEDSCQVEFPKDKSRLEIEKKAKGCAIVNALENAFGRVIISGNSTYIYNLQSGDSVETKSVFNMVGNSFVNGEVIGILTEEYKTISGYRIMGKEKEEVTDLRCIIEIKAREIIEMPVEFIAYTLSRPDKNYKSTSFHDNDSFYLYFKCPENGYLNVYLDDNEYAYRLIPDRYLAEDYEGGVPVNKDRDYVFFSSEPQDLYNIEGKIYRPVEYVLLTDKIYDLNRFFIIFSTQKVNRPPLNEHINPEIQHRVESPKGLQSEDFQKWLQKLRSTNRDVWVAMFDVTITSEY